MKATILYCDRCHGEGKEKMPAAAVVWIRTSLGGRPTRQDVCADHFTVIVGHSTNGPGPPSTAAQHVWSTRGGAGVEKKTYERLLPYVTKHSRFSFDDALIYLGKDVPKARLTRVLKILLTERKLERYAMAVYQQPGYTMVEPATLELASAAVLKIVKAKPGIRGPIAAAYAGVAHAWLWKRSLNALREQRLIRTKGLKAAMRLFPV